MFCNLRSRGWGWEVHVTCHPVDRGSKKANLKRKENEVNRRELEIKVQCFESVPAPGLSPG